jgi:hypothetical protein
VLYRCILSEWAKASGVKSSIEGLFNETQLLQLNEQFYNIYYFPNSPSMPDLSKPTDGSNIDTFQWIFVDMDLKDNVYASKQSFLDKINSFSLKPTKIVDSGNGIHAYWKVSDLTALNYLFFQRRLCRHFNTDEAVSKICQLMRVPGYINTKNVDNLILCELLQDTDITYTSEVVDNVLPIITLEDETYCKSHYNKTYNKKDLGNKIVEKLPLKFAQLLKANGEVKDIWIGNKDDRSKGDYRLGHIMFASGFTKEEASSVLVNSAKALERAPTHRISYATNIIDKIWSFEAQDTELLLSSSVRDILTKSGSSLKGTRFPCWSYLDSTHHGFRLGQVIGLVAGSGVGKTAIALNMFLGFVQNNPDYDHFFVPLEQPGNEIAERWKTLCGDKTHLHDKVHIISNYNEDGSFRHLSLVEIKDYLLKFEAVTKRKVGCVVIDHIGALKKKGKNGENQDLIDICHSMKAFAIETNTMLVMQSQAPREKAGIGDLELNKDAAYGTVYFESYCDFLITIWQPLKRCYSEEGCPTTTAFKFCKIRHKNTKLDKLHEDVCYKLFFTPETGFLREFTENEEKSFTFFNTKCLNKRKESRQTDIVSYTSIRWTKKEELGQDGREAHSNQDSNGIQKAS